MTAQPRRVRVAPLLGDVREYAVTRRWAKLAMVVAAAALVTLSASAYLLFSTQRAVVHARKQVARTTTIRGLLSHTLRTVLDCESGVRGYVLTRSSPLLDAAVQAKQQIDRLVADLTREMNEDAQHVAAAREITRLAVERVDHAIALAARAHAGATGEELARHVERGTTLTETLRAAVSARLDLEAWHRDGEEAVLARARSTAALVTWLLLGVQFLLWAAIVFVMWRSARADALVTLCAWSKTIQHEGEWMSIECYLQRRFGIRATHGVSPAEAEKFMRQLAAAPPPGN